MVSTARPCDREAEDHLSCPRCGCREVYRESDRGALSVLLFGFPFFRANKRFTCDDCGHTWKKGKR